MTTSQKRVMASARTSGPIHQMPHSYWSGYLGVSLVRISRARTLAEAKRIAREGLAAVSDPVRGLRELDEDVQTCWRRESHKED